MKYSFRMFLPVCLVLSVMIIPIRCFSETITFDEKDQISPECAMNSYYNGYLPAYKILGHFYAGFWLFDRESDKICYTAPNYGARFGGGTVSFGARHLPVSPYRFISRTIRWCSSSPPPPYNYIINFPEFMVKGGFSDITVRYRISTRTNTGGVVGKVVVNTPLDVYSEDPHEEQNIYATGLLNWQTVTLGSGREITFEFTDPPPVCIEIDDIEFMRAFAPIPPPPVKDTTPPVISINGDKPMELTVGTTFVDPGASATDNKDGPVPVTVIFNNVSTSSPGEYSVRYEAEDAAGNKSTAGRRVIVRPVGYQELEVLLLDKRLNKNMDPIWHPSEDKQANTFRMSFMLIPHTSRIFGEWMEGVTPCQSILFQIHGENGGEAEQIGCNFEMICPVGMECPTNGTCPEGEECGVEEGGAGNEYQGGPAARVDIDFRVEPHDKGYYFKNGTVEMCSSWDTSDCRTLDFIHNFTVYGTSFDLSLDAFRFKNGAWGEGAWIMDFGTTKVYVNDLAKAGHVVSKYLSPNGKSNLWHKIGYFRNNKVTGHIDSKKGSGLCFGMAAAALANFNNATDSSAWGVGNFSENNWKKQIEEHWDTTKHEARKPYRPFIKRTALYEPQDIEALKKIIYYYVMQEGFENDADPSYWNGDYWNDLELENPVYRDLIYDKLKKNSPFIFTFFGRYLTDNLVLKKGGHAVLGTQFISYNNIDKWYLYDNNIPDKYLYYRIADNGNYKVLLNVLNDEVFLDGKPEYSSLKSAKAAIEATDPSHLYKQIIPYGKSNTGREEIEYPTPNHIEINVVGGNYIKIVTVEDNSEVTPLPCVSELDAEAACQQNDNIFKNQLLLPVSKTYKVSVRKESGFPFLQIFVKIPKGDGTVELINYEDVETDPEKSTLAVFRVGLNNSDKTLTRVPGSPVQPVSDTLLMRAISPVSHPVVVRIQGGVRFFWENPEHPDFSEVVVVRSEDGWPESVTDGTEVYRGNMEQFEDHQLRADKDNFYAFFVRSPDGVYHAPVMKLVAAGTRGVYGKIEDADGKGIAGVVVTLVDKDNISVKTRTNRNGLFGLNGLTRGTYHIAFSHYVYSFDGQDKDIIIEGADNSPDVEVTALGKGKPELALNAEPIVSKGEKITIRWDGVHVDAGATVRIRLFSENRWETLASEIPFADHKYQWWVTEPEMTKVALRVELSKNTDIFSEKSIGIASWKTSRKSRLLTILPGIISAAVSARHNALKRH